MDPPEAQPFVGPTLSVGLTYSWQNLCAQVPLARKSALGSCWSRRSSSPTLSDPGANEALNWPWRESGKVVLDHVSGIVEQGDVCAILGASGAGKSTLLNALTMRNVDALEISGERYCNAELVTPESLTAQSAYVQQDDMFIGTLTVREHLQFQARVRMDRQFNAKERMARVKEVIQHFGLDNCADVLIGVQGRIKGISGGESKRLALASEVLTNPLLMFCDEPTSGLDSYMAQNVVETLKNMAGEGKTVIITIHQPSSQVFEMFNKVLLLANGRVAFHGSRENAEGFFRSMNMIVPQYFNPADFYVQKLAMVAGKREESEAQIQQICDTFQSSTWGSQLSDKLDKNASPDASASQPSTRVAISKYKVSWWQQFSALMTRTYLATIKEPLIAKVKIMSTLVVSLVLGFIYYGQKHDQAGIMNINGAIFIIITNLSFENIFAVIMVFCNELPIFLREHANGMYRTDVYLICKQLVETPVFIITTTITVVILYWMTGMNPDPIRFLGALGIALLLTQVIVSFGYMISCIVPNAQVGNDISPVLILPFMLVGGFFLNNLSIPTWLIWLKYISWFKYANECLVINQWSGVE
ncbi:hypothetical protein TCAL_04988 [Tigriopus californicus]|uniref:Protein white n=2 Tax=Tigriopus californicus TaxID=6832 RepID=A0A553PB51_TIGCA|nr:hypothetical protein TCAL_04988 [Tigriopus californicus]|eukprot:TCALIF_04988-PA protein Name:"Similar to w Protein white (Drosophila melanogaster)" AED:0.21 eAED:0.21 QI:419/1/1/1/1/1/2/353/586